MVRQTAPPVLDENWAAFIQSGVSIIVGARDSHNVPSLARAVGCRVSRDFRQVVLLISAAQAEAVLNEIRLSGALAAIFSQPSTHITIQLKSNNARAVPIEKKDAALAQRYSKAFVAEVCPLGYSEDVVSALVWSDPADLVALIFNPEAAFLQTPGPRAGEPLRK